jgi:hypothetical protein
MHLGRICRDIKRDCDVVGVPALQVCPHYQASRPQVHRHNNKFDITLTFLKECLDKGVHLKVLAFFQTVIAAYESESDEYRKIHMCPEDQQLRAVRGVEMSIKMISETNWIKGPA